MRSWYDCARPGDADARDIAGASFSISVIAWPELLPGAAWPCSSNEGNPWKRSSVVGAVVQPVRRERREGHHLALVVADEPVVDVRRRRRDRALALHIDPLHPAAIDEVVDVAAAPGGRERRVDVIRGEAERGETLLVDIDLEAGDVRQFAEPDLRQHRIGMLRRRAIGRAPRRIAHGSSRSCSAAPW